MDDNYKQYVDLIKMNYHPRLNHHIKHLDGDHLKAIIQKADKHHHLNRLTMDIFPLIDYIYSFYYVYYDILEFVLDYEDMHDNRIETFFHINMSILNHFLVMNDCINDDVKNKLNKYIKASNFIKKIDYKYGLWGIKYNASRTYYIMIFTLYFYNKYYPEYNSLVLENIIKDIIDDYDYFLDEIKLDGIDGIFLSKKREEIDRLYHYLELYIDRKILNTKIIK